MNVMDEPASKRQKVVVESSTQTQMKDLPEELVMEILCRLRHCKYVFQCKCVSKHWSSLTTSPYFVRRFITCNKMKKQPWAFLYFKFMMDTLARPSRFFNQPKPGWEVDRSSLKLITQYSEFKSHELSLKFLPCYQYDQDPITMLKTFNDLILCCAENFDHSECVYYICNPLTKQWVALPPTPPLPPNCKCLEVEFICEPYYYDEDESSVILYDQFKFKVFRFLNTFSEIQVFSSETGQWNMTQVSLLADTPNSRVARSFFSKGRLSLIVIDRWSPKKLSVITVDDHLNESLQRVNFPGNKFCRSPFHSTTHVSSRQGSLYVVQISISSAADQPNYGVPVLRIWNLEESDNHVAKWKLSHQVSFRNIASQNKWISDYYLKEWSFITRQDENLMFHTPIVLGFHPYKDKLLYLNLNYDEQIGLYDISKRTLNFASATWRHCNSRYGFHNIMWSAVSEFVLPLWPTPVPQINQAAALPCQS
ncbi:hypothetical protein L6164_036431 [Bauhinia variegata]|uniref:Uncharacterized protein n=1 Tax=Bauhinia variegata TaxID=167791 RepID=A0ACB9KH40_BAUVA|nr:hypothetical protein L6164_036431 [Bauhinia variegata]